MPVKRRTKDETPEVFTPKKEATNGAKNDNVIKLDYSMLTEPTAEIIEKFRELIQEGAILNDAAGMLGIPSNRLKSWIRRGERDAVQGVYGQLYKAYAQGRAQLSVGLFKKTLELAEKKCDARTVLELYNKSIQRDDLGDEEEGTKTNSKVAEILKSVQR